MGNNLASIDTWQNRILSVALLMLVLCLWEAAIFYFEVPKFVLPPPSAIALGLWRGFLSGVFIEHLWVTLFEVLVGFALGCALGFVLGVGIALNRYVAYFLYPYVIMFQSMPKVALAPLIVLWFGLGITSKVVTAALVSFFPLMVNTIAGLASADEDRIALIRSLGGSERQVFTMLRLPSALPFIMAGIEIALALSLIGTVVTEFLGAERGLGMLMQSMNFVMDVAGSFAILLVLAVLGLVLNQAIVLVRAKVLFWENMGSRQGEAKGARPGASVVAVKGP
jgi:NitT/TauT family transport system permease protein